MTQSVSNGHPLKHVVAQAIDDGIEDIVHVASEPATIEQATRILMLAYDLDADNASELLKWGAQMRGMGVVQLAESLAVGCKPADLRTVCDEVLFAAP